MTDFRTFVTFRLKMRLWVWLLLFIALLAWCGTALAITPVPTATRTPTPTPTPTPEPPTTVCSVQLPSDNTGHLVTARVTYLHEASPCESYRPTVSQYYSAGSTVRVTAYGSPVGATIWVDGVIYHVCGEGEPIFKNGFESGSAWTPCYTPTPQAQGATHGASTALHNELPDGPDMPKPSLSLWEKVVAVFQRLVGGV